MSTPKPNTYGHKPLGDMRLAYLYARFSPRPNAAECESAAHQVEDCKLECDRQGWAWSEDRIFMDEDESGKDWDRAGLWDLLHALRPGGIVVVREFDRLARDSALGGMVQHMIDHAGCELHLLHGFNGSADDPMTAFVRGMLALIAEWQGHVIAARARAAIRRKFAQGLWPRNWVVPYGWRRVPGSEEQIEPVPEQQLVRTIIQEYRAAGKSRTQIANALNEMGHVWADGNPFNASRVWTVIRRDLNQYKTKGKKPRSQYYSGFPMFGSKGPKS